MLCVQYFGFPEFVTDKSTIVSNWIKDRMKQKEWIRVYELTENPADRKNVTKEFINENISSEASELDK